MSSFFLIHAGWGQESGTNGAREIGLYSREALIIFHRGGRISCYMSRCTRWKHDQFNLHRKSWAELSNVFLMTHQTEMSAMQRGATAKYSGPQSARLWSSVCFQNSVIATEIAQTAATDRKRCKFVIRHLSHWPTARISPIVNVRGVILFLTKREKKGTSHMVNKAPKQCASLFKMIMTAEGGCFKAAPSLQTHRGAFAQRKAWLLYISHQRHQTWQTRPFSRYQPHCWTQGPWLRDMHTTNSYDYSKEWTSQDSTSFQRNRFPMSDPGGKTKTKTQQLSSFLSFSVELQTANITNFNAIIALIMGWDIGLYYTCAATMKSLLLALEVGK